MNRRLTRALPVALVIASLLVGVPAARAAEDPLVAKKLQGFDEYMAKVVKDWNVPGIGVGVVVRDKLVFAKGYGYRDYGKKLPFTPRRCCRSPRTPSSSPPSAMGLLVEEGKLEWDRPVRRVRAEPSVLQRRVEQHGHHPRHAGPPDRHHPARR